jgi:hypothetical protein
MVSNLSLLFAAAMLGAFLISAAWHIFQGRPFSGVMLAWGALGFFTPPAIAPAASVLLENFELPAIYGTTTIQAPDGRRIAFTTHLARVQLYHRAGQFERGWFAKTAGGLAWVALTTDGKIAVAAVRTRKVEFFFWDGSSAGPPQPFTRRGKETWPSDYLVDGVTFDRPVPAANPGLNWNTLLLFPLSHPFIAWLFLACGLITANYPWLEERWRSAWRGKEL